MKVAFFRYILTYQSSLRLEKQGREGALLKVMLDNGLVGFADCHPWPEIGDKPLAKQIESWFNNAPTPLMSTSLKWAQVDAQTKTRIQGNVRSHFLGWNVLNWQTEDSMKIEKEGFTHIKFKVGRKPGLETHQLRQVVNHSNLRLRLDFNETLSFEEFKLYLRKIEELKHRVDYIEDPFPFHQTQWQEIQNEGWKLACDKHAPLAFGCPEAAQILILKPAVMSPNEIFQEAEGQIKIVTSYAAHPLDQLLAARIAEQLDPECKQLHGLLSHRIYEPTIFSEKLSWHGSAFGLGELDIKQELAKIEWVDR